MKSFRTRVYLLIFVSTCIAFFWPFFLQGKLPIPADTLVGLYHPWRDAFSEQFPNGYPYKNPLITDPVRQQYPYRLLSVETFKKGQLPKWNPYSFAGTPLLANIQSAAFYPLNNLFWILPAPFAWSVLVTLTPLLAGIFTYFYLRNLELSERASFLGALTFAYCGFMVSWMEWNTLAHTALWLPLILLAQDKLIKQFRWRWAGVLVTAESCMILAGHLQTAMYIVVFSSVYLWMRIWQAYKKDGESIKKNRVLFSGAALATILITLGQLLATGYFVVSSARTSDLGEWVRPDWFIPWKHLVQFVAPDFFGNPATGNYYGVWNYGEFIGYVALFPLLMAVFAMLSRRDIKTYFFGISLGIAIILAVPNAISRLPYVLGLPFLSTLQPSRILIIIDFCLAILAALGLDYIVKPEKLREKRIRRMLTYTLVVLGTIWVIVLFGYRLGITKETLNTHIAGRNLAVPTGIILISAIGILGISRFALKNKLLTRISIIVLLSMTILDFYRFFHKFTPFVDATLLYPNTATITYLQENLGNYRILTTDRRIMPPNVSMYYKLASVDGYDPLYLKNYSELIAIWTRMAPDITPAAFNRIITPENYSSPFADLLGVKYVLSLKDEHNSKLKLVFQEGETRVYENTQVIPRVFFAQTIETVTAREKIAQQLFVNQHRLNTHVVTEHMIDVAEGPPGIHEQAVITSYEPNKIVITAETDKPRLLVLTDIYYPDWKAYVNGVETKIYEVDLALRGVVVPAGQLTVEFRI